jgi:hypothetical protein
LVLGAIFEEHGVQLRRPDEVAPLSMVASGALDGIKAAVAQLGHEFPGSGPVFIEGEEPPARAPKPPHHSAAPEPTPAPEPSYRAKASKPARQARAPEPSRTPEPSGTPEPSRHAQASVPSGRSPAPDPSSDLPLAPAGATEDELNPLQQLIHRRLRERDWSCINVARRGGLPRCTVYNLAMTRNLAQPPSPATLDGIAKGLDVPVSTVRAAAAGATGLHYYDEVPAERTHVGDPERELLIASAAELTPESRRHVATFVESMRRRPQPTTGDRADPADVPGTVAVTRMGKWVWQAWLAVVVVAMGGLWFAAFHYHAGLHQKVTAESSARAHAVAHGHPSQHGQASPASALGSQVPTPATLPARTLTPVTATAFGPNGGSQGDNGDLASHVIDAHPATAWHTDWYATAHFGNLYPGTGLLVDMGRPVTITAAQIALGSGHGASLQLRVGTAPALADLPPVALASNAGGVVRLRLAIPAHGRYVLVWFTSLPPDPAGTFQASVYSIRLEGRI